MYLIEDGATGAVYENVRDYGREGDRVTFHMGNGLRMSIPASRAIITPARYASDAKDQAAAEKQRARAEPPSPKPSPPKKRKEKAKGKPAPARGRRPGGNGRPSPPMQGKTETGAASTVRALRPPESHSAPNPPKEDQVVRSCKNCAYSRNSEYCGQLALCSDWKYAAPIPDYWPTAEDERRAKSMDLYRRNRGWD